MSKKIYKCSSCHSTFPKWYGKCPDCSKFNTIEESNEVAQNKNTSISMLNDYSGFSNLSKNVCKLSEVEHRNLKTTKTGMEGFDKLLSSDGGLVSGSVTLIGGDPGIGKSTLLLQLSNIFANMPDKKVLYISGEESDNQLVLRAKRLNCNLDNIYVANLSELNEIIAAINLIKPNFMVIDSIQSTYNSELPSKPASVAQIKECAFTITKIAKSQNIDTFMIGHVTKDGDIAGPQVLEHLVDTTLYFEGDKESSYRTLHSHKNRYGSNEMVIFEMTEDGLREVLDPSVIFLENDYHKNEVATALLATQYNDGNSAMLIEVQSLLDMNKANNTRRIANGIEYNRLSIIIAIINKIVDTKLYDFDVFVNVVSGLKVKDSASDLAVFLSIISFLKACPILSNSVVFGEIGLNGNLRLPKKYEKRIAVAAKVGIKNIIMPYIKDEKALLKIKKIYPNINFILCKNVYDAVHKAFSNDK